MAMTQATVPASAGGAVVYDSTSGLYYIVKDGNVKWWIGTGTPDHHALTVGDQALNTTTGDRYNATDTAGTWELLSAQS